MSIFMIIGKFGCRTYATAEYFARHLTLQIPSVRMKSQSFPENDFEEILSKMRSILHCEHTGSPLIWRDLQEIGTSPSYIGGISEFFDFCKEYYDVIMPVNPYQAFCITEECKKNYWRESMKQAKEHTAKKISRICIIGAGNPAANLLSLEIILDKFMYNKDGLELRLHDYRESEMNKLESLKWDLEAVECPDICKRTILVIDDLYDAVKGCNLLIIMCEAERQPDERLDSWLTRNHDLMKELGERIDEVDVITLNAVVTGIKLLCFNTSVLLKYCNILTQDRTIAVTHHLGLEALQYIANVTKVSPNDVFGSPVWGYVGINHLVDICHTKCLYRIWGINKRPRKNPLKKYKRAVIKFTDPPPKIIEKRDTCFRTHTCELMWQWVYSQKVVVRKVYECDPYMSQVNATMHIIRMWMNETGCSNEIISVGIMSDGSYGIPKGIVYSLPVVLQESKWKICNQLPVPHYSISLKDLIPTVLVINDKFNLADDLPNFEDYYLPSKTEKNVQDCVTNMIQEQKELRKKRELLLNNAKFLSFEDEVEPEDHKKGKLSKSAKANNKLKIIEELKKERTRMKEINQSNKYSWLNKWLQKMKLQQEDGKVGLSKEDIPPGSEKGIEGKERRKSTENELEQLEDEEKLKKLFEVTPEEVTAELEQFDIIKVLGEFYGNKILKKYEKPVQPPDEKEKDVSVNVPCTCPEERRCIEKPKIKKKSNKKISS